MEYLRKKANDLPLFSGVYIMKNKSGKIIYIGKAKKLKNRVSQYFNNSRHDVKVQKMISNIYDFDYIITDSEFEALILECSLIKQNMPKYNILLKDDKGYNYIEISDEEYPKIRAVFQKDENSKNRYIGPFTSSFAVTNTVETINDIFMLPTCNRKFPRDFLKERPCLNYYIKKCEGACLGKIKKNDYNKNVNDAINYLIKNKNKDIEKVLNEKMLKASENLDFEKASVYRDKIFALKKVKESQKVILDGGIDQDVFAIAFRESTAVINILKFRNGTLCDKEEHCFYDVSDVSSLRNDFLSIYYIDKEDIPKRVILDDTFYDIDVLKDAINKKNGKTIQFLVPQRGENHNLVLMAMKNSIDKLDLICKKPNKDIKVLSELKELLHLEKVPRYIESYDISNLSHDDMVGTMIVFKDGRPLKRAYRKFKIKEQTEQDDYKAMSEVIKRRFTRYLETEKTEKNLRTDSFCTLPDIILLDGGKGHVSTMKKILSDIGINVPVFGMQKNSKHKSEAISFDGKRVEIKSNISVFRLITNIQDEVHRFSITYQRTLSKKRNINITIKNINGIGDVKAKNLLKHFKSIDNIKKASINELLEVNSITKKDAETIVKYFK